MAGIKSTEKEKKRNMASNENATNAQQQDHQRQQQDQVQTTEPNNERRARPPLSFPPLSAILSNNYRAGAPLSLTNSEQEDNHDEDLKKLAERFAGGELEYLIEWFEQVNKDLEKIRRELDIVQKQLRDSDGGDSAES